MKVLVVTAVPAERDAVLAALAREPREPVAELPGPGPARFRGRPARTRLTVDAVAAGVGPAAAAATASAVLAGAPEPYGLVVSAGVGGGFGPAVAVEATVVASTIVAADLGSHTPDGFLGIEELGFGVAAHRPPERLARAVAAATGAAFGPVLTVQAATGSAERAAELAGRHRGAAAEAMEGFGVATAAALHGVPVLEIRTVSNAVGPRDRDAWRIPAALRALTAAFAATWPVLDTWRDRD
ncbi:futalosine hydrolase [Streptomyces johnsoniae]|uniref:Futalosine hydrolase n=1 Tax=Streptomyces johnsoniae TaxID=3075532 RepID=A0ABU2RYS8_9ACTN|nr:futalosine hydrolase [Streptomyces sp. DSM 41886]MDT0441917.1 futalosine hydrolase [Streptomyces sp. DSM 41886]